MKNWKYSGKHRPVIAIYEKQDISQAPEFKRLIEVDREMTSDERNRTSEYLKEQDKNAASRRENKKGD